MHSQRWCDHSLWLAPLDKKMQPHNSSTSCRVGRNQPQDWWTSPRACRHQPQSWSTPPMDKSRPGVGRPITGFRKRTRIGRNRPECGRSRPTCDRARRQYRRCLLRRPASLLEPARLEGLAKGPMTSGVPQGGDLAGRMEQCAGACSQLAPEEVPSASRRRAGGPVFGAGHAQAMPRHV